MIIRLSAYARFFRQNKFLITTCKPLTDLSCAWIHFAYLMPLSHVISKFIRTFAPVITL